MAKIPIIILTGFLGSGKTTLLSEILRFNANKKISVIINEFGEVGLDNSIINQEIMHTEEKTLLLQGGCVCCNKREDLIESLRDIIDRVPDKSLDYIIIETTGLANPAPILFSIQSDPVLQHHFFIKEILTCIDCLNVALHLKNEEALSQMMLADRIILTKQDICDDIKECENLIASHNILAQIIPEENLDFSRFLDSKTPYYDSNRGVNYRSKDYASHTNNTHSLSIVFKGGIDWEAFCVWLSALLYKYGEDILRIKGILDTNEEYPVAINGVQHIMHPPTHLKEWLEKRESEIIIIFRNLQKEVIKKSFESFCGLDKKNIIERT